MNKINFLLQDYYKQSFSQSNYCVATYNIRKETIQLNPIHRTALGALSILASIIPTPIHSDLKNKLWKEAVSGEREEMVFNLFSSPSKEAPQEPAKKTISSCWKCNGYL